MKQITVLIVDDNFVIREGLRSSLAREADIVVVGEASTSSEAIQWIQESTVDVVLMDIHLPDIDGVEATAEILKIRPGTKVLVLTVSEDVSTWARAIAAGAKGYLVYGKFTPGELVETIRTVESGEVPLSSLVAPAVPRLSGEGEPASEDSTDASSHTALTLREMEIMSLIAAGKGNQEIARVLNVEEKTVKNHISNIYSKLHLKSRYEAISYFFNILPRGDIS